MLLHFIVFVREDMMLRLASVYETKKKHGENSPKHLKKVYVKSNITNRIS